MRANACTRDKQPTAQDGDSGDGDSDGFGCHVSGTDAAAAAAAATSNGSTADEMSCCRLPPPLSAARRAHEVSKKRPSSSVELSCSDHARATVRDLF